MNIARNLFNSENIETENSLDTLRFVKSKFIDANDYGQGHQNRKGLPKIKLAEECLRISK
jgi:hypothetical protein